MEPQKCIKTDFDMMYFERSSPAYALLLKYVEKMCLIASGKFCQTQVDDGSTNIISSILDDIHTLAESIEPINQPMRFGNKAFRALYDALAAQADSILSQTAHLSPDVIRQFKPYLMDSFGNPVRIDYGTGHEAAFLALFGRGRGYSYIPCYPTCVFPEVRGDHPLYYDEILNGTCGVPWCLGSR
jgi:hypothetical protein